MPAVTDSLRVWITHRDGGVDLSKDAPLPSIASAFQSHLTYPHDRSRIERILAHYPDKWLRVYVEQREPLTFEVRQEEGVRYHRLAVSTVRRGGLERYHRLRPRQNLPAQTVQALTPTGNPCRLTLRGVVEELLRRGWIAPGGVAYDYTYMEPYLRLLDAFRRIYRQTVCRYPRCRLPSLVSNQTLARTRLSQSIIHECMHVREFARRRLAQNQAILNDLAVVGVVEPGIIDPCLRHKGVHLSHNCCLGLWPALQHRTLSQTLRLTDWDGVGFRNQGGAANGRERFEVFRRIQSIMVGTAEAVELEAQGLQTGLTRFLQALQLRHRILCVTPWYGAINDKKTLDWQVWVDTPSGEGQFIQVANLTRAGTIFTKCYGVSTQDGHPAHSGCSGVGLERLATIFLAQHGMNPEDWPAMVRQYWQG